MGATPFWASLGLLPTRGNGVYTRPPSATAWNGLADLLTGFQSSLDVKGLEEAEVNVVFSEAGISNKDPDDDVVSILQLGALVETG